MTTSRKKNFAEIIKGFQGRKILIIGDVMLDRYLLGTSDRISPEAPIPVIKKQNNRDILGGAANVASNIASLGGVAVLCGIVGHDPEGDIIKNLCDKIGVMHELVCDTSRPTTTKTRIVVGQQQIARIDTEHTHEVLSPYREKIVEQIQKHKDADVVVISDYAKGMISERVMKEIKKIFNKKILADFKPKNAKLFKDVYAVFPNQKEAFELTGYGVEDDSYAEKAARELSARFRSSVVLKRSNKGMTIVRKDTGSLTHIPTNASSVFDVTGAGDTVVAVVALALAAGSDLQTAAMIANSAAGVVVGIGGTTAIQKDQLLKKTRQ